jgi:hypothetical protein
MFASLASKDKDMPLFIWNSESKTLRTVIVNPHKWSEDSGILGCDIFFGVIHRIPPCPDLGSFPFSFTQPKPEPEPEKTDDDDVEVVKPDAVLQVPKEEQSKQ